MSITGFSRKERSQKKGAIKNPSINSAPPKQVLPSAPVASGNNNSIIVKSERKPEPIITKGVSGTGKNFDLSNYDQEQLITEQKAKLERSKNK